MGRKMMKATANTNKTLILVIALLLTMPVVTHAGSATSRWDITLGGFVKFDTVWANKAVGVENRISPVDSKGNVTQVLDSTDNLTWAGGETRLNWLIKGPDAWGAKTSAFIEGQFRGRTGGSEYGLFSMRHGYMQMIWPKTKLIIGQTWQQWGFIPSLNILGVSENHFNKGQRVPQITVSHALTKHFTGTFGVQSPYRVDDSPNGGSIANTPWTNGTWPDVIFDVSYASNACGKIGPWPLKVGIGGFYGRDKYFVNQGTTALPDYSDEKLDRYGAGLYWYVPIIPETKGNKAGAFAFTGQLFAGKGMILYLPAYSNGGTSGAYIRNLTPGVSVPIAGTGATNNSNVVNAGRDIDLAYYGTQGGWVQGTYYLTNKLFMNVVYGAQYNNIPGSLKTGNSTGTIAGLSLTRQSVPERIQNLIVNIMYDVNPAIRFALEYANITTAYAYRETATLANQGSFDTVHASAYYFF
jgi:hypothetical protein